MLIFKPILSILFLIVVSACCSIAQQRIHNFIQYSEQDGLPSNSINGLAVDNAGLLWLTSKHGLAYFDGTRFIHVPFQQGTSTYSNYLGKLAIDREDRIWITTNDRGLLCYDRSKPINESLKQFHAVVGADRLIKTNFYDVTQSSSGFIYFGGQETDLQALNPRTGQVQQIKMVGINTVEPLTIYSIREDREGNLWLGTRYHGFIRYNPKSKTCIQVDFKNLGENGATGISFVNNRVFLGYYDYDLVSYDPKSKQLSKSILGLGKNKDYYDNFIAALAYWPEANSLVIGHNLKGLWHLDLTRNTMDSIHWADLMPILPKPSRIQAILPIKDGYWLGTESGLFYYSSLRNKINTLIPISKKEEAILKIIAWGDELWYRTDHYFGQLDSNYRRISAFPIGDIRVSVMTGIGDKLYFSTFEDGVYVFSRSERVLKALPIVGNSYAFRKADCNTIIPDTIASVPVLWIGSWNSGLYKYVPDRKSVTLYSKDAGLPDHKVITLGKDVKGRIWLGMDGFGAVRMLDKELPRFHSYVQGKKKGELLSNTIFAFYSTGNGDFWFSSAASGIGRINENGEGEFEFIHYYDRNPFPWLYAVDIEEDGMGSLWVKALDGVMLFDQKKQTFRHLLAGRGVYPDQSIKTTSFFIDDRTLIWTTSRGLITGNLADVYAGDRVAARPIISKFSILNQDQTHRLMADVIQLEAFENSFSFAFSSDRQHLGTGLKYAYQLEGFDQDWITAGDDLQAFYSNLPAGNFKFKVRVDDGRGNWSTQATVVYLTLKSYWYLTWWFKTLLVVLFSAAIISFFLYRIKQQKLINKMQLSYSAQLEQDIALKAQKIQEQAIDIEREKQEKIAKDFKQKLYESELKAIRSQMNPHFIFNVLNSIEAYVVENDSKNASMLIQKFASLSRIVLENSQFSIVNMRSELQLVKLYLELERSRFDQAFDFHIDVDPKIEAEETKVPSLLIQPLVENAVHHGVRHLQDRKGIIELRVYQQDVEVIIDIRDNGIGFSNSKLANKPNFKSTSFGIKGIEDRLKMINDNYSSPIAHLHIMELDLAETGFKTLLRIILPKRGIVEGD